MPTIRSAIAKGRAFQRRICERIKAHFGLTDDDIRPAIGAETGEDIKLTSERAREIVRLSIECKDVRSINIFKALEQARRNCKIGQTPAVVFKNGSPGPHLTWICVPFEHYLPLRQVTA